MSLPYFIRTIDPVVGILLIWLVSLIGFMLINSGFFSTKKSKGKQIADQTQSAFKKLDFEKRSRNLALMKQWSEYLDRFPLFKMTPEKRNSFADKLKIYNQEKLTDVTIEEVHVQKWKYFALMIIVTLIAAIPLKAGALFLLLFYFCIEPLAENKVMAFTKTEVKDFDTEFYNFFCVYIAQFNRLGTKTDLSSVLSNYSDIAPEDMQGFCTYFRIDLGRGPDYALRELRSRYALNQDVQEFCTLAEMVNNGNQQANTMADNLLAKMEMKAKDKREAELNKLNKTVTTSMTAVLVWIFILIFIVFIKSMLS